MNSTPKKLKIQVGTQEHVIAVYSPNLSRWVALDALGMAYIALAERLGFTDLGDAGPSTIRVDED